MQQRYYDPAIGRFLSVDPVTADGATGANFNRYWYANNNPYRFTDPDGRLGRGSGWTDDTWNQFNATQSATADAIENQAASLAAALAEGNIRAIEQQWNGTFPGGTATPENVSAMISTLTSMATVLRDDGTLGYTASAMSSTQNKGDGGN